VAAKSVPERLHWAVETLAIGPDDQLLEIGCGRGVAVALICEKLAGGRITAIDRSAVMIGHAEQRNFQHVASGKAVFHTSALESCDIEGGRFDKIFAVNVNLFWVRPAPKELDIVKSLLTPQGTLYLFYEPPGAARVGGIAGKLEAALAEHGFATDTRVPATDGSASMLCVVARAE